jgi:hypothetical protein
MNTQYVIKYIFMDSDSNRNEKENGNNQLDDSDLSKPIWVRRFGLQNDSINKRLLEYNVRSLWIGVPIVIFVLLVL